MPYIINTCNGYIKRTARYGPFYGRVVYTDNIEDARLFTRRIDAETSAKVVNSRHVRYLHDRKRHPLYPNAAVEEKV